MAIDATADVSPAPPGPLRRISCRCGSTFAAASRPDPTVLDPWVDAHTDHDPSLPARVEEAFRG